MFGSGGEDENKEEHKSLGELASKKSGQGDGCRSRTGELCCDWAPSLADGKVKMFSIQKRFSEQ